jgi:hypothetical protein
MMRDEEDDTEAAATPTQTMETAMIRIASFMIGNLRGLDLAEDVSSSTTIAQYVVTIKSIYFT